MSKQVAALWFTEEERKELSSPVIKRIIKAIRRGEDRKALSLCDDLKEERILLHDFFADTCTALFTWVGSNLGEERLYDMFTFIFEQSAQRQIFDLLNMDIDRGLEATLLVRGGWVAHSCSGAGEHGGAFRLEEDDEKFTFIMDPCGSGGRLWRKGRYETPYDFAVTSKAYPWTFNREGLPYYCVHCPFLNELLPMQYLGFPTWPVDPPTHAMDECRWYVYKDKWAVPQSYYDRYGWEKKKGPQGSGNGERWFSEEQLKEIIRPTPDRIRDHLNRGDLKAALRICREMGGEFFFLHSLYVNMLVATLDFIAREAGDEGLGRALSYVYEKCVKEQMVSIMEVLPRREALRSIIHNFFLADTCGGVGYPPARFEVREDEYGVTVLLNPCGSGGKLLRHGTYEPPSEIRRSVERFQVELMGMAVKFPLAEALLVSAMPYSVDFFTEIRKPEGMGRTERAYDWSGGRRSVPYYCTFCTSCVQLSGVDWLEVIPPGGRREPCVWRARK
jgi:hypothetical protein